MHETRAPDALVLLYHAILPEDDPGEHLPPPDRAYALSENEFRVHVTAIRETEGWAFRPVGETPEAPPGGEERGVLLTFDDSWPEHAEVTAPILAETRVEALFFLTAGELGRGGRLSRAGARELSETVGAVGSHGLRHRFLTRLSESELKKELTQSKLLLEEVTGRAVTDLSCPGGRVDERVLEAAFEAGYMRVHTSRPGFWRGGGLVPRVCMRPGDAAAETFCRLLGDPEGTVARLARAERWKARARRILGDGLYDALQRWRA